MIKRLLKKCESIKTLFTFGLLGFLGAFIFFMGKCVFIPDPPSIATVDLTSLVHQYILKIARDDRTRADTKIKLKLWSQNLEIDLQSIAKKNHVVLMPRQAVISPVKDYTKEVSQLLNQKIALDPRFNR